VNLLQNAIQHSLPRSTVHVRVSASEPDTASIVVEDSGTGIPAEDLPYVFERFRRGDPSRSRATGGFGLGLSICRAILEAYGGRIEIESTNGAGTRVFVSIPALTKVPALE
jgi:signal transduction histidine kinase